MNLTERIKALFSTVFGDVDRFASHVDMEAMNILHELAAKVEAIEQHLLKNNDSLPHKYVVPTVDPIAAGDQSSSEKAIPANTAATGDISGDAAAGSEAVKTGDGGQQNDLIAKTGDAGSETVKTDAAQV